MGKQLGEIKSIVTNLASGVPAEGSRDDPSTDENVNDLKRALPTEIARVATTIAKLEKEKAQLEECKMDIEKNLFEGFDDGIGEGLTMGSSGAEVRNLAAWRRLNEFKLDI